MKYIFVTGGVVSGLGKGITAASLGRLFKSLPRDAAVMPFPNPETTPPVTNMYFIVHFFVLPPFGRGYEISSRSC